MFEESIGFKIMEHEPQEFCHSCTKILIEWYKYKEICHKTQVTLELIIPIKAEPETEVITDVLHRVVKEEIMEEQQPEPSPISETKETEDVKSEELLPLDTARITEQEQSLISDPNNLHCFEYLDDNSLENVERIVENVSNAPTIEGISDSQSKTFTLKLETYVRYYQTQPLLEKNFLGLNCLEIPNHRFDHFFRHHLWNQVKGRLVREVVFTEDGKPIWTSQSKPQIDDLTQFIEFQYKYSTYLLDDVENKVLRCCRDKKITLYIYPYSRSIKTKNQWISVTKNLFKFKKRPEKKLKTYHKTKKQENDLSKEEIKEKELPMKEDNLNSEKVILEGEKGLKRKNTEVINESVNSTNIEKYSNLALQLSFRSDQIRLSFNSILLEIYVRNYKNEPLCERQFKGFINLKLSSSKGDSFFKNFTCELWLVVKEHVEREVIIDRSGRLRFSPFKHLEVTSMTRFIEFYYKDSTYLLSSLTSEHLQSWIREKITLYIYPYSRTIETKEEWIDITKKLKMKKQKETKRLKTYHEEEDSKVTKYCNKKRVQR